MIDDLMRTVRALAFFTAIVACGSNGPLSPSFVQELVRFGGCGDILFYAVDGDDELILSFGTEGVLREAQATGEGERTSTFTFPTAEAELVLEQGTNVSDATCDDAIVDGGPRLDRSWTASAGTATLRIRPHSTDGTARADLLLEDVVLEGEERDRVTFQRLEWRDVRVGWYPG